MKRSSFNPQGKPSFDRRGKRVLRKLCLLVALAALSGSEVRGRSTHVLIITSASGGEEFGKEFGTWAADLERALTASPGIPESNVHVLVENPTVERSRPVGKATKGDFLTTLERIRAASREGDLILLVLIGHATHDGSDYKFNVVGPDVSGADLRRVLGGFETQKVVLVAATPASGPLTGLLRGRNRVIITATKSALENNHSIFAGHFAEAFKDMKADADKNEEVSVLEAYLYAAERVKGWYRDNGKLVTEHSLLEDDGDGIGAQTPSSGAGDGRLAAQVVFRGQSDLLTDGPRVGGTELERLRTERNKIAADLEDLKSRKGSLHESEYEESLEKLLVALALTDSRIRRIEKGN